MSDNKAGMAERREFRPDESVTRLAAVQSHACVLVVGDDGTIRAASDNSQDKLGRAATELLGRTLGEVLSMDAAHSLRAQAQLMTTADPVARVLACSLPDGGRAMDVTATRIGADVHYEFEPAMRARGAPTDPGRLRRMARRVSDMPDLNAAATDAARTVSTMTGFARVTVHRVGRSGLDAALGVAGSPPLAGPPGRAVLRAQAQDFGPHLRLIPDVAKTAVSALVSGLGIAGPADARPTWAETRGLCAAAPADDLGHALARDRVRAALTVPVRVNGDLWGVILCHHDEPRMLPVADRAALALFAQLLGDEVERLEYRLAATARGRVAALRESMAGALDDSQDMAAVIRDRRDEIAELIPHDGRILWHHGRFEGQGRALTQDEFTGLFAVLHPRAHRSAQALDRLADIAPFPRSLDPRATAAMVLPLSHTGRDLLVLFRSLPPQDDRVHSWERWEVEAGEALRGALVELQVRLKDTAREANLRASERQGLLIAELNHRTRNMLNLIQGMVGQSVAEGGSLDDYARVLEGRILALARAHDDLAEHDWGRVGLRVLLERALAGHLNGTGPVARIAGDPIDLSPAAFTTMALVLHELVCNARAHGALSVPGGRVDVTMTLGDDGFADLVWTETGGPAPVRPATSGFGLTVIERSVPHELRGTAELSFPPGGMVARFALPPGHFMRMRPDPDPVLTADGDPVGNPDEIAIDGAALILDDSLIIAIESADLLRAAGASEVYSCNSVETAMRALDNGDITFALLDVNLGEETSLAVAEQVWIDGIPAVLATGYGANEDLLSDFPPLPVLSKPYTVAEIKDVLHHFRDLGRRGRD